jgi:predicted nucleic acid-binding protein
MTDLVFVDTNVLVYARDAGEPDKQPKAAEWLEHLWRSAKGRVSVQVLREFYVTVTSKLDAAVPRGEARKDVRDLLLWRHDIEEALVVEDAWRIEDRHKIHWWDALIVAAAQRYGCRYLLSEDFSAGATFDKLEVVNPFDRRPEQVLGD